MAEKCSGFILHTLSAVPHNTQAARPANCCSCPTAGREAAGLMGLYYSRATLRNFNFWNFCMGWTGLDLILFFNKIVLIWFYVIVFLYPPWRSPSSTWLFCMQSETIPCPQNCSNLTWIHFVKQDVINA